MTPHKVSTDALAPPEQLEAWREWYQPVFDVTPRQPEEQGFLATSYFWALSNFSFCRVTAPALSASRTKALIRANPVDHWVITLGQRATTKLKTRHAAFEAPSGIPFVLSLGEELESERQQDDRLQLYLPRDHFREIGPLLDKSRGQVLDTPLGKLLGDYLLLLERRLPEITLNDSARLTQAVSAMVAFCVGPTSERLVAAASQIHLGRLEKVRQVVHTHLRSPSLGAGTLCRQVGVSRSQLYRLLEGHGGVSRYIQRQRLLASRAMLSDLSNPRRVADIAETLCFADASSFSRAFRQEFDVSPTDVRNAAMAGQPLAVASKLHTDAERRSFARCLHSF